MAYIHFNSANIHFNLIYIFGDPLKSIIRCVFVVIFMKSFPDRHSDFLFFYFFCLSIHKPAFLRQMDFRYTKQVQNLNPFISRLSLFRTRSEVTVHFFTLLRSQRQFCDQSKCMALTTKGNPATLLQRESALRVRTTRRTFLSISQTRSHAYEHKNSNAYGIQDIRMKSFQALCSVSAAPVTLPSQK